MSGSPPANDDAGPNDPANPTEPPVPPPPLSYAQAAALGRPDSGVGGAPSGKRGGGARQGPGPPTAKVPVLD